MTAPAVDLRPHRLVLAAAELELLRRLCGDLPLPGDFAVGRPDTPRATPPSGPQGTTPGDRVGGIGGQSAALAAAARSLAGRGVLTADPDRPLGGRPHPSVLANLQVLAEPEILVETRVRVGTQTVRAAHAVGAGLGASLARVGEVATVELSFFPAERLGLELVRAVPDTGSPGRAGQRPAGVVPLDALAQIGLADQVGGAEVVRQLATELRLTAGEQAAAQALAAQANGVLHSLVTAPPRPSRPVAVVGQVLWYATPGGWVGLAPQPQPDGRRTVRLSPVEPVDLGAWLAPLIAEALA
jgi:hypothetical protein